MMRSLSSGVAGLRTHQTKMDVIGNNIANVNTYGFKASRTTFADVYYQNLTSGRSATGLSGGMNPTQLGYGSAVATIDIMQDVSGKSGTDRAMDVYIAGDGFLVSKDVSGSFKYTRLGNLGFDAAGNLVDSNGNFVQGFPMNADGTPNINADGRTTSDGLQGIHVDPAILDKLTGISINTSGAIVGMLPGDTKLEMSSATNPDWINNATTNIPAESNYRGDINLAVSGWADATTFSGALGCTVTKVEMGNMPLPAGGYSIAVSNGIVTMQYTNASGQITTLTGSMDKNGQVVLRQKGSSSNIGLTLTLDKKVTSIADKTDTINLQLCTQLTTTDKGGNTVKEYGATGATVPQLASNTIKSDASGLYINLGDITLRLNSNPTGGVDFSFNGIIGRAAPEEASTMILGNLVLAKFRNPGGLAQAGTSTFESTVNSGDAEYIMPGVDGTGTLSAGSLETSNVDLSNEFTEMITTQRGFQANSRIITVSDSMLEELVNLKR